MPRTRIALALAAAAFACDSARDTNGNDATFATGTVCPPGGTTLTYQNFAADFFGDDIGENAPGGTGYCNYCHASTKVGAARNGAPAHAVFDQPGVIREHADLIDAYAGKGPINTAPYFMPFTLPPPLPAGVPSPQPFPTDEERTNLSIWLACGAAGAP